MLSTITVSVMSIIKNFTKYQKNKLSVNWIWIAVNRKYILYINFNIGNYENCKCSIAKLVFYKNLCESNKQSVFVTFNCLRQFFTKNERFSSTNTMNYHSFHLFFYLNFLSSYLIVKSHQISKQVSPTHIIVFLCLHVCFFFI